MKILLADDDELVLFSLKVLLEQNQIEAITTTDPERIPSLIDKQDVYTVLLDMNFRVGDTQSTQGLFWLKKLQEQYPDIPVIPLTAYGDIGLAVEAMKRGAHDFITKPWQNERLIETVKIAVELCRQRRKVHHNAHHKVVPESKPYDLLLGESVAIREIRKRIEKVSPTDTAVLITGENGTGKEVVAREIHRQSARSNGVFVSVDVGSISSTLFESELFGHKKGAFTDAREDRIGRIEAASGGTLFLDEIGNLSWALQAKLLTVLQHKTITRLGTNQITPVDIRVISATNSDLRQLVKEGKFREDLYYRINTVEISLPALFDRPDDIPLLVNYFLNKYKTHYQKNDRLLTHEMMEALKKYRWPGNVRELQHAMERAVILSEAPQLTLEDFGIARHGHGELSWDNLNLEKLEAWAIRKAIDKHKGNISHAATELGLSRGALYRRMQYYNL